MSALPDSDVDDVASLTERADSFARSVWGTYPVPVPVDNGVKSEHRLVEHGFHVFGGGILASPYDWGKELDATSEQEGTFNIDRAVQYVMRRLAGKTPRR